MPLFRIWERGTDICGPFQIKGGFLRNSKPRKVYVLIFICISTKGVDLNLSTNAYLAVFWRFTSKGGQSGSIRHDNGTNLAGVARILDKVWQQMSSNLEGSLAQRRIIWHPGPPMASHYGELFETRVDSFKCYVKKCLRCQILRTKTFIQWFCFWEVILNSRSLYPLKANNDDLQVLTPGHFLIQRRLHIPKMGRGLKEELPATKRWR